MREPGSLGDLVRAELASLELRDTELVERLCGAVEAAARTHGVTDAAGTVSAAVAGTLAMAVLEGIIAEEAGHDDAQQFAELEALRGRLTQLRADPDNVENLSFRDLARRFVRGRRSEK